MAPPPAATDSGEHTDRNAFVEQLPKRIAAIEEIWARLDSGSWDTSQLDSLYDRVREISESSKTHALYQLNESVFSLEVYLSSFVGSDTRPGTAQMDSIGGLLRALHTAARVTVDTAIEGEGLNGDGIIAVLGDADGVTAELVSALRELGCEVRQLDKVEPLLDAMQQRAPRLIIADTALLPGMSPLSSELTRLRNQLSVQVPLIFVSTSTSLQLRVDAIRAGGDGYFVAPLDADVVAARIRDMALPSAHQAYRVLVVEDDPTQAEFAASILRKGGIEVMQILDPVRVIDDLRSFKPDLILMDIYMPEVNGIELTTIIRDHHEFLSIPIVFLSGEQNADKQLDALSVGGDDFIAKPIRPKHLLSVVESRIRRARQMMSATGTLPKHDRVTGLFSRQQLIDRLARTIDDDATTGCTALIVVQPDNLLDLRQQLGMGGVDHLLSEFAAMLPEQIAHADLAARLDEHSVGVLVRRDDQDAVIAVAERFCALSTTKDGAAHENKTVSCGVCFIDDQLDDANGIIKRAFTACNDAAKQGGNRVAVHQPEAAVEAPAANLADDLPARVKKALRDDAFIIQYQPMLDLQTRGSETYEVVLRLENPHGDLIGGRQLLEAAEEAGVGQELDHWILDRAIDILKQRRESGRRTHIFVHQSVSSALDPNLPAITIGRLRQRQIVGSGLILEFNLTDLSRDLKTAQRNIKALHAIDVAVSLSRFPEKEAAFKVLRFLHANYINIAPRLLKADRQVISSVISQAHDAKAKVIVSNIDDPRSIDLHWSSGADFLQGNFIQRPLENMDYDFSQVVI